MDGRNGPGFINENKRGKRVADGKPCRGEEVNTGQDDGVAWVPVRQNTGSVTSGPPPRDYHTPPTLFSPGEEGSERQYLPYVRDTSQKKKLIPTVNPLLLILLSLALPPA